jgi:UDPglucose 6-dehydrogenase|tara:strand:+ start:406 stop:1278 length:873 start_codon:yes stop_codon:yes gene_type:complete
MTNIGIVGQGFVGSAVKAGLETEFNVLTYDKFVEEKTNSSLLNIVSKCDVIFVCVPTPMDMETGECHIGIVESVVRDIDRLCIDLDVVPTLVVKSTVPPGTIDNLNDLVAQHCNVTFNPEFLTEANAVNDFINQNRIVLGGDKSALRPVVEIFESAFPGVPIKVTTAATAEMVKYTTNCFLATKVSFANEIYDICRHSHIDYNEMVDIAKLDTRLGNSHWMVPGPDGDRGYGGHCFPKDMTALRYIASQMPVATPTLDGASKTNSNVRKDLDWEEQEGRAVINTKVEAKI